MVSTRTCDDRSLSWWRRAITHALCDVDTPRSIPMMRGQASMGSPFSVEGDTRPPVAGTMETFSVTSQAMFSAPDSRRETGSSRLPDMCQEPDPPSSATEVAGCSRTVIRDLVTEPKEGIHNCVTFNT